jgi:hypothetical protein
VHTILIPTAPDTARGRAVSGSETYFLTVFEVDAAEVEVFTVTKRYDFFFDVFVV